MTQLTVSELATYPVKSFAQNKHDSIILDEFGFKNDRRWMVVDPDGIMITQRVQPRMCLVKSLVLEDELVLSASGMDDLHIHTKEQNRSMKVKVWDDYCSAVYCGDEATKWLSSFLGIPARLVFFPDSEKRQVDMNFVPAGVHTAFSDGFPILLLSSASIEFINEKLDIAVDSKRFRPNLVISGCEPFAEDNWKVIEINNIRFTIVKPCSRCSIPGIIPETAERDTEINKILAEYRRTDNKVYVGQNVVGEKQGNIEVGMPVTILE